jgi:hypothetical protein
MDHGGIGKQFQEHVRWIYGEQMVKDAVTLTPLRLRNQTGITLARVMTLANDSERLQESRFRDPWLTGRANGDYIK